jgi:hypothetical protein
VVRVPAYSQPRDNTIASALSLPFRKQRDYWRAPDGSVIERKQVSVLKPTQLAE